MKWLPLVLILTTTGGALADAPSKSLRPMARVQAEAVPSVAPPAAPEAAAETVETPVSEVQAETKPDTLLSLLRPKAREESERGQAGARAAVAPQQPAPEAAPQAEPAKPDTLLSLLRPRTRPESAQQELQAEAQVAEPAPQPQPQPEAQVAEEKPETLLDLLRGNGGRDTEAATRAAVSPRAGVQPETYGVKPEAEPKSDTLLALLRPKSRSRNVEDNARRVDAVKRGKMICGDPSIQGVKVGRVAGAHKGCGLDDAVRVSSVAGIGLSTHAVMDCTTAKALNAWVEQAARPAIGTLGGGLSELRVAAHYACRPRNNQRGAKISEHGKGHAIDIAGFKLRNGQELSVLRDWNGDHAKVMRAMHKAACGPFGTVLGPNADRFHRDHYHFDTARYRSGTYCR